MPCAAGRSKRIDQAFVNGDNSRELMRDANIISLFNVVEHISDPLALLKAISLGARPNAWIVIEVPRHPSISSLSNAFFPAMSARHICPPDHLHIFTDKSLRLLLEQAKIDAKALWFFGQDYQDLVMTGVAGSDVFNQAFLDQVLDCAPAIQQSIDQAGLSDTVLVVGRFSSAS